MPPKKKPVLADEPQRHAETAVRAPLTQDEVQEQIAPVFVGDGASGLYRDRSGPARGVPLSEGRDNFAAVTAEAHKTVALATKEAEHAG